MRKKKLRLLVTKYCERDCAGCCNKDIDLDALPVAQSYKGYKEISISGGEPLSDMYSLENVIKKIKRVNKSAKIYVYTSRSEEFDQFRYLMQLKISGITLTVHNKSDKLNFYKLNTKLADDFRPFREASLRLIVLKGVNIDPDIFGNGIWHLKNNVEWQEKCPLPEGEELMRVDWAVEDRQRDPESEEFQEIREDSEFSSEDGMRRMFRQAVSFRPSSSDSLTESSDVPF